MQGREPVRTGTESVDLLCGNCARVIFKGLSEQTVSKLFSAAYQPYVICSKCGSHNQLPAQLGN